MRLFFLACAGGAVGAGMRHLVNMLSVRVFGLAVPWATLSVNIIGSFAMGMLVALLLGRMPEAAGLRIFLATGILGGFTTFSAFSLDVVVMAERGDTAYAVWYVIASVALSIAACFVGLTMGRVVFA